jgi:hypothetical protein
MSEPEPVAPNSVELEPRNAAIVVCEILENIPEDQTEFREELNSLLVNEFKYRAPEVLKEARSWVLFEKIMHKYIQGNEPDEWKKKCVAIYIGKA